MFDPSRWACAFVNSVVAHNGNCDEAFDALKIIFLWVKKLPGDVSGRTAALNVERLIRNALPSPSPAQETAAILAVIMVKKNVMRHSAEVTDAVLKILDRKNNRVRVLIESASASSPDFDIAEAVKKFTGSDNVEIRNAVNPDLLAGYKLRMGDDVVDSSLGSQIKRLKACLAAGKTDGGF